MEELTHRVSSLLTIKSLVTLALTAVFAYLALMGEISGEQFLTVFTVVIAFYFGTQSEKNHRQEAANDPDPEDNQNH